MKLKLLTLALTLTCVTPAMAQQSGLPTAGELRGPAGAAARAATGLAGANAGRNVGGANTNIGARPQIGAGQMRGERGFRSGGERMSGWHGRHDGWRGGRHWRGGPAVAFGTGLGYGSYSYDDYAYEPSYSGQDQDDSYCAQRYRSYDPASGTYMGYDGRRHPCP